LQGFDPGAEVGGDEFGRRERDLVLILDLLDLT
jgi:hypothetical protein